MFAIPVANANNGLLILVIGGYFLGLALSYITLDNTDGTSQGTDGKIRGCPLRRSLAREGKKVGNPTTVLVCEGWKLKAVEDLVMHGPPLRKSMHWLPVLLATVAAPVRKAARTPLTRPRLTTRRMMMLVALMAIALWASMKIPRSLDFREMAEQHAIMEGGFRERVRERQARVNHFQADLDRFHLDPKSSDEVIESYLASRLNFELADTLYLSKMASHHAGLNRSYRRAMWRPWESVADDPPPPDDPLIAAPTKREGGKHYHVVRNGGEAVAYSPDGAMVAIGQTDGAVRLQGASSGKPKSISGLPAGRVHSLAFSPDGTKLAGAGDRKIVLLWDTATGSVQRTLPWVEGANGADDSEALIMALAFSPDGGHIAVAACGEIKGKKPPLTLNSVRLFDTRTGKLEWEYSGTGAWTYSVAFSPDGATVACDGGVAILLDSRTGAVRQRLKPVLGQVFRVAFSPDGRIVAGGGGHATATDRFTGQARLTLWDARTGTLLQTLEGPKHSIETLAFSSDGKVLAGSGMGEPRDAWDELNGGRTNKIVSEINFWSSETGKLFRTVEGGCYPLRSLAFSPDGRDLVYSDEDHAAIVEVRTGLLKRILQQAERKEIVYDHPRG